MAEVVEAFVGHTTGKSAVPDYGDNVTPGVAAALYGGRKAVGVTEGGRGVAVFDPVVHRLSA
jgi:hypothetical protein